MFPCFAHALLHKEIRTDRLLRKNYFLFFKEILIQQGFLGFAQSVLIGLIY